MVRSGRFSSFSFIELHQSRIKNNKLNSKTIECTKNKEESRV